MPHSQNFDKIDSFLKPALNIFILGNLIVAWGDGVIKDRAGIQHQIYRFRGGVKNLVGVGFVKVRVGPIKDPFKQIWWNFLRNLFSAKIGWLFL